MLSESFVIDISRYSTWNRLLLTTQYVLEAADRFKNKKNKNKNRTPVEYMLKAEEMLLRISQFKSFSEEIRLIKKSKIHEKF